MDLRKGILTGESLKEDMKISDDYNAKYRFWAGNPRAVSAPAPVQLPHFKSRRFSSHAEMNEWKRSLLREFAEVGPKK